MYEHPPASPVASQILVLGETTWRRCYRRFGLLPEDRLRHLYVLGKTGTGKSTLLGNLIAQDLAHDRGLAVLDPHGPLAQSALLRLHPHHTNRTLLFRPADHAYPVSFNVFRQGLTTSPALLASNLVAVFKKHWSAFWGPRLEHVLRNAILAVIGDEGESAGDADDSAEPEAQPKDEDEAEKKAEQEEEVAVPAGGAAVEPQLAAGIGDGRGDY